MRLLFTAFLLLAFPAFAADTVTECDRLGAHHDDPDRIAAGAPLKTAADQKAAVAACEADLTKQPTNLRIHYQLARALFYSGDTARGIKEMKTVADAGYRQAQFVFGAFINNKRPGAPTDICVAEDYWWKSANAGRQAARLSYVRHVLKGKFAGCKLHATKADLDRLLAISSKEQNDYYQRVLIEDLKEMLVSYKG